MKLKNKLKRGTVLALAIILAAISSLGVYAAVSYDSSKDPVVAYSGMVSYVESVLSNVWAKLNTLEARIASVEINGGGGAGSGASSAQVAELMKKLDELSNTVSALQKENSALKTDLKNAKNEFRSLYDELSASFNELQSSISSLSTDIKSLQSQITSQKKDLTTLSNNFKQIADISTQLNTLKHKVDALTSAGGDITVLKEQVAHLEGQLDSVLSELGKVYEAVYVPYGATVIATDEADTVMLILRTGSAVAVSPYVEVGTIQGLNNLTLGTDICNGENIPPYHSIMIPRGGDDGRGVTVTSLDGAYFLLGGDFTIVNP
jgi:CII-binding regulator of phage lambda lysogenization HflD